MGDTLWGDVPPRGDPLADSADSDACVVGAGIAGLTAAYFLARHGKSVTVLDARHVGAGDTHRSTAHLSFAMDDGLARLEAWHGQEQANLLVAAHRHAVLLIEQIVAREGIDCAFERVPGYLAARPGDATSLEEEAHAARRLGLPATTVTDSPLGWGPALRFDDQAQMDPALYLAGLRDALLGQGVAIHPGTRVVSVEEERDAPPRSSGQRAVHVETRSGHAVHCDHAVIATNAPVAGPGTVHTKMSPHRTYALAVRVAEPMASALLWDRADPYHYVRTAGPGRRDLLIVGGADHRTGHGGALQHQKTLAAWVHDNIPGVLAIEAQWSGQIMETADGAGFIGGPGRIKVITGDSGHGITNGTLGARIVAADILGQGTPWSGVFDAGRFPRAVGPMLRFTLSVAGQEARRALPGTEEALPPRGSGRVLERGWEKVACYRAPDGSVHEMDAHCTHRGCLVSWNDAEASWDCPCHGSRFDAKGVPVQGPATAPLEPLAKEDQARFHGVRPARATRRP